MKKIISVLLATTFILAILASCNTSTVDQGTTSSIDSENTDLKSYNFNLATTFYDPESSPDFNVDGLAAQRFADLVNERSNGRVTITIHWGGVLGTNNEALEQVRSGDIDMNISNVFTSLDSRFGVFNLPNLMDDYEMVNDLFVNREGPVFQIINPEPKTAKNNKIYFVFHFGYCNGIFCILCVALDNGCIPLQ